MKWRKVSDFWVSNPGGVVDVRVHMDPLAATEDRSRKWRVKINGAWIGDVNLPFPTVERAKQAAEAYVSARLEDAVKELGGTIEWQPASL